MVHVLAMVLMVGSVAKAGGSLSHTTAATVQRLQAVLEAKAVQWNTSFSVGLVKKLKNNH